MRITGIETIRIDEFSNLLLMRLHTDDGLIGIGETFRNAEAVEAYIHETAAPFVLGQDPLRREALSWGMARKMGNHFNGFPSRSVEIRGNSAIDMALWDVCGQAAGVPISQLLGGQTHDKTRIYNTCAGGTYNAKARSGYNTEIYDRDSAPAPGEIAANDDLLMQVFEPARLAKELIAEGTTAMKIWPFDPFAVRNNGQFISADEMREAIWPIEQIRKAVGDKMDIMIEYHSLWQFAPALQIAAALGDYGIYWHEDPFWLQNFDDLARYRDKLTTRLAVSENLGSLPWFREALTRGIVDVATFDIAWIGGITEGQKVTHLAQAFDRPVAPHDCTGPVTFVANIHMLTAASNSHIAECVRSYWRGYYSDIVTDLPVIQDGYAYPMEGTGLCTTLNPAVFGRADVHCRLSGAACDQ
ncbi:MAG: mandelate racemase/muconate lactonizing enzyme family protein [Alphaproteobacteria bacterium]|nr:mandelate racemase/muconate lactonizing enzyme family protein [Alphaproteobacteria bacterium]